jgi:SAM-dependent methyltransferase
VDKFDLKGAQSLRNAVCDAYSAAADKPTATHPFPVGRRFAEGLGYPDDLLDTIATASVEAFAGVSNVSSFAALPPGFFVLDLGCGAGLDSLIAARRVGDHGRVLGVDFSAAMLKRAHEAKIQARVHNVVFCRAAAEILPLKSASVDVAIVNGIFNLNPMREAIFAELSRVVRTGGSVFAAELILGAPLAPEVQKNEANWFA